MLISGTLGWRRVLIVTLACAAAVYLGLEIPEQPFFALLLFGLIGYICTLPVNYRWCAWVVFVAETSAIIVPSLPGRPFLWEACAMAAWPSLAAYFAMNRAQLARLALDREAKRALAVLGVYAVVLVMLMAVRGVGFRAFGGEQMGGRFYVQQLILAILPLLFLVVDWRERSLVQAFFISMAFSLTYLVSDLVFIYGNRATEFLLYFLELPTDAVNFYMGYEVNGLRRFQSFAFVGSALFSAMLVAVALRDWFSRKFFLAGVVALAGLGLGLASGHRTVLIQALATVALLGLIQRFYTPLRATILALLVAGGGWGLYHYAADLPMGVQRAVSFLPGIKVDPVAAADAEATVHDRVEVLKLGLADVPRYLWIGRGFGMDRFDRVPAGLPDDGIYLQYQNGLFYNGTIGLLLKTGLAGLLAALGYIYWISVAAFRCLKLIAQRDAAAPDLFDRFCQFTVAKWFAGTGFFLLLHGDAGTFMQVVALQSALVLTCLALQRRRAQESAPAAEPVEPTGAVAAA